MTSIYDLEKYTIPIDNIMAYIREYDISKANINILLYKGIITKKEYDYLYGLPKINREIAIGMKQKNNHKFSEALQTGFSDARHMFYNANNIKEDSILSIKKDAIFLIEKIPKITIFENIDFKLKNVYVSYYNLARMEFYYTNINQEKIDIKGMSEESIDLHKNYFYDLLCFIFSEALSSDYKSLLTLIKDISNRYINGEFDIEYYREFNNRSLFRTKYQINNSIYYLDSVGTKVRHSDINPIWNYSILQELYKIYMTNYLSIK
jgi:hypothetical protein